MSYPSARSLVMMRSLSTRALGQPSETSPTRGGLGSVVTFIGRAAPLAGIYGENQALRRSADLAQLARRNDAAKFEGQRRNVRFLHLGCAEPAVPVRIGQVEAVAGVG